MDNTDYYYLYKISNTIDSSVYIGITNDPERRFREHLNSPSNKYLEAAMNLFGKDKFIFNILCCTNRDSIDALEIATIKNLRDSGIVLYNISNGGLIGNGAPGEEHWNHKLTEQDVIHIRNMYSLNMFTQRKLAEVYNIGYKAISKIVRGERWKNVSGPITKTKQEVSKVANRRKLTDDQIIQIRNEAYQEYELFNSLDISSIADMYGINRGNMRKILKGEVYRNLCGPLLAKDYYKEFGNGRLTK